VSWEECQAASHVLYCPDCEPEAFACPECDCVLARPPTEHTAATGCTGAGGGAAVYTHRRHRKKWRNSFHRALSTAELHASGCTSLDAVQAQKGGAS